MPPEILWRFVAFPGEPRHILASHCQCLVEPDFPSVGGFRLRPTWNEHAVACGLQAGDREAWALLFEHHSERVWRYVAKLIGGDTTGVADVVQETFLAAAQSARSYDASRGPLAAWLLGIAHRQVSQQRRRSVRHSASVAAEDVQQLAMTDGDPVVELEQRELAAAVRVVLAELPSDYSVLLVGKYSDGRSIDELVTDYGGTTESVRSKLARARREFQTIFERRFPTTSVVPDRTDQPRV